MSSGAGLAGTQQVRVTTDRADDVSGPQVHFLYVVPRDGEDRALDTTSVITRSAASWQGWLKKQTDGRIFQVDTFQGELDISFFRLNTNDAVVASRREFVREQIEEELYNAGYNSPTKMYAVYYDGSSTWSCGGGDPQPTFRGNFSALYLKGAPPGAPPCASNQLGGDPPGYLEFAMLHELVHSLGFVPRCAPHARGDYEAGHVSDSRYDLMWSGNEPWGTNQPDLMQLDVGRDDYYAHGRSDCPDLASSPYLVAAPKPPPATIPTEPEPARVVSFSTTPTARAGGAFYAALMSNATIRSATCRATLGARRLSAVRVLHNRTVRCTWKLPPNTRGVPLRGSLSAQTVAGVVSRTFSRRVR
jgi:hypothetical protein